MKKKEYRFGSKSLNPRNENLDLYIYFIVLIVLQV